LKASGEDGKEDKEIDCNENEERLEETQEGEITTTNDETLSNFLTEHQQVIIDYMNTYKRVQSDRL
jgi:hypothetical protein